MASEQDKEAKRKILEAFGLNERECEIENSTKDLFGLNETEEIQATMEGNSVYLISPKQSHKKLPIKQIGNLNIFNEYNLIFVSCIFEVELLIERKTITKGFHFQECTFEKCVSFNGSIFNSRISFGLDDDNTNSSFKQSFFKATLSCKNSTFNAKVAFFKSEFNTNVYFQGATFNEYAHFKGAIFNGVADFYNAQFKSGAVFSEAHFNYKTNRGYSAIFKAAKFSGYTWFKKAIFCSDANFEAAIFEKDVLFNNAIFSKLAYFPSVGFYGLARFSDVIFHKSIFGGSRFKERAFFSKAYFQGNAFLSNVIFEHNVYFHEAEFLGEAKFKQSEFYMNAHFYGTIFKEIPQRDNITMNDIPNFLQIILNGYINLTNTKQLLLSFEQLKSIIDGDNDKEKDELANEFRNTFKNFKNGLIKDNNLIDASQFHKMELYAKELEVNYKKERGAKDWTEKIQLMLYRLTSDHHTDLLLILNNMFGLIALFAIAAFLLCCFASYDTKWVDYECCTSTEAYYLYSLMTNSFCVDCNMGNLVWLEICLILALCLTFAIAFILMVAMFYCINAKCKHLGRWFIVIFFVNALILAIKPALILPIFGKLIDESLKVDFPAFTSLSIVYAILMFLLIWSLQKTARKNTIVPN